jgi:hypothetical protein
MINILLTIEAKTFPNMLYNVIIDYVMASKPGLSTILLYTTTADMDFSRRYNTIDH